MSDRVLKAIRGMMNPWLACVGASRHYDLRNTLAISGVPRSGTTWLAELVCTIPGSALMFEPLNVSKVPAARAAGIGWHPHYEPGDVWQEGEEYLEKVLKGQVRTSWTTGFMPMCRAIRPRIWVIKFVSANMLLGWLAWRFPIRTPVLLLRHPCATIASRSSRGWKPLGQAPRVARLRQMRPDLAKVLDRLKDPMEYRAAQWCVETYVPLALPLPYPFHIICYERLVQNGARELELLFDKWRLPFPSEAVSRLTRPSQTTWRGAGELRKQSSLTAWRDILSPSDVSRILDVLKAFDLDFYSCQVEPDYDRLPRALG